MCSSAGPESAPVRWALNSSADLSWKPLDDEIIVFNAASGDTHLLNLVSAEALRCLGECPVTAAEMSQRVGERLGLPGSEASERQMADLLSRFDELGLVEPR